MVYRVTGVMRHFSVPSPRKGKRVYLVSEFGFAMPILGFKKVWIAFKVGIATGTAKDPNQSGTSGKLLSISEQGSSTHGEPSWILLHSSYTCLMHHFTSCHTAFMMWFSSVAFCIQGKKNFSFYAIKCFALLFLLSFFSIKLLAQMCWSDFWYTKKMWQKILVALKCFLCVPLPFSHPIVLSLSLPFTSHSHYSKCSSSFYSTQSLWKLLTQQFFAVLFNTLWWSFPAIYLLHQISSWKLNLFFLFDGYLSVFLYNGITSEFLKSCHSSHWMYYYF